MRSNLGHAGADGELASLPELAIPFLRARSAIFDTAIWHQRHAALAAIRQTGGRVSRFALMVGGPPVPPDRLAAQNLLDIVVAKAGADFSQRLRDGRLQVWGQVGSIRGNWQPIGPHELAYLRPVRGDRDRWEGGGLCYYRPHVLDLVGVERELALRIYGPIKSVRHLEKLEGDPGADSERRRALAELEDWIDAQLNSQCLLASPAGDGGPLLIRPAPPQKLPVATPARQQAASEAPTPPNNRGGAPLAYGWDDGLFEAEVLKIRGDPELLGKLSELQHMTRWCSDPNNLRRLRRPGAPPTAKAVALHLARISAKIKETTSIT